MLLKKPKQEIIDIVLQVVSGYFSLTPPEFKINNPKNVEPKRIFSHITYSLNPRMFEEITMQDIADRLDTHRSVVHCYIQKCKGFVYTNKQYEAKYQEIVNEVNLTLSECCEHSTNNHESELRNMRLSAIRLKNSNIKNDNPILFQAVNNFIKQTREI